MNNSTELRSLRPRPPDAAGVLSCVHIGDLHMRDAAQQNDLDLQAIVEELDAVFAGSISFVFLRGDNADYGDGQSYQVIRRALDRLRVPWVAIVGDHDTVQRDLTSFKRFMAEQTHYAFTVGAVRFFAMNAFDVPEPGSFAVLPAQLNWIEDQLRAASAHKQAKVLLLHCY